MKKIFAILKLTRVLNLTIVALTLYIFRWYVFEPALRNCFRVSFISDLNFYLLTIAAVLTTAAGYIINDYFDQTIDGINKPEKQIVGTIIKPKFAQTLFYIFSAISIILGTFVAYKIGSINLAAIPIIAIFMLWYYSFKYKRTFLWGNIVISFLSGFLIVSLWLFEFFGMRNSIHGFVHCKKFFNEATNIVFIYFIFAFLISLIREIVKDMEDVEGDKVAKRQTLPIKLGMEKTKKVLYVLVSLFIAYSAYIQYVLVQINKTWVSIYSVVIITLPVIYVISRLYKADDKQDYTFISGALKIVMGLGLIMILIYGFL